MSSSTTPKADRRGPEIDSTVRRNLVVVMSSKARIASALVFLLVLLLAGVPYWLTPKDRLSLPESLYGIGLALVSLASAWLQFAMRLPFFKALLLPASAPPAVVLLRVVVDVVADPTSHNLWPFEVVIALALSLPLAFLGALFGKGLSLAFGRKPEP